MLTKEKYEDCKELKYLKATINDWYKTYSKELLDGYQKGSIVGFLIMNDVGNELMGGLRL